MPNILPVSDLRNYNEVLKNCVVGEPVFLTKNGREKSNLIPILFTELKGEQICRYLLFY